MNAIDFFDSGYALNPDGPCLVDATSGASLTYRQVRDQTFIIGNALRRRNFSPGEKAAVWGGNHAATLVVVLSVIRTGLAWIPVNVRNTPQQNAEMLREFGCDILFLHASLAEAEPLIRAAAPNVREIVLFGEGGNLEDWTTPVSDAFFDLPHDPERLYSILPSTGTSGRPKGIMTPVRATEAMTANILASAPCPTRPLFLAVSPLSHASGGFMHYFFAQGGTIVLFAGGAAGAIVAAIRRFGITHSFLAPTVIYDLIALPETETAGCTSLHCLFYGGASAAPAKIREAIRRFGPVFAQVYGQVEVGGGAVMLRREEHLLADGSIAGDGRLASCGRAMPFTRVAIMADDGSGRLLPPGELGEIVFRGQGVMLGYHEDPAATAAIGEHGWHHSQDIGLIDAQGFLHVVDRKRDMIISGGFNIYSIEVENAALAHPAVLECAAIGVPDPRWGEAVKLLVRLAPGWDLDAPGLIAFCKERIGSIKAPKTVESVKSLPRNSAGKILKAQLRAPYWQPAPSAPQG